MRALFFFFTVEYQLMNLEMMMILSLEDHIGWLITDSGKNN